MTLIIGYLLMLSVVLGMMLMPFILAYAALKTIFNGLKKIIKK